MNVEIEKLILKCIWKCEDTEKGKTILKSKERSWITDNKRFEDLIQNYNNQDDVVLEEERNILTNGA